MDLGSVLSVAANVTPTRDEPYDGNGQIHQFIGSTGDKEIQVRVGRFSQQNSDWNFLQAVDLVSSTNVRVKKDNLRHPRQWSPMDLFVSYEQTDCFKKCFENN